MKKTFFTLLCLTLSFLTASAQGTYGITPAMPKILKYITPKNGRVNIRKAPSTSAATMVRACEPETDNCWYEWSNERTPGSDCINVYFEPNEVLAVVGESGDFYQVFESWGLEAYIAKSVVKEITPDPMNIKAVANESEFSVFESGPYKDIVICNDEDMLNGDGLLMGRIVGNTIVLNQAFGGEGEIDIYSTDEDLFMSESGHRLAYNSKYALQAKDAWGNDFNKLNISSLSSKQQEDLMKWLGIRPTTPNDYCAVYACFGGRFQRVLECDVKHKLVKPVALPPASNVRTSSTSGNNDEAMVMVEVQPQFPGGQQGLMSYLSSAVKYPSKARKSGIQGRVIVKFIVEKDGSISNASIQRSADPLLDEEALRVINAMPRWTPGMQKGKPVRVNFSMPITFRLN